MENEDLTKQFETLFNKHISTYAMQNQYGVSSIPFHVHTGVDSPQIDPINLLGFPTISTTSATTAPTDAPINGTIRFYYDGTYYIQWVRINNTWEGFRLNSSVVSWISPHVLFDHYATVGNTTTNGTVDTLYSDTIIGSQLGNNGEKLEAEYGGSFVTSGTATREVQVFFAGSSIFDTGTLTVSLSSAWTCYVSIIRVNTTVVRYLISFTTEGAALAAYTAVGELTAPTTTLTSGINATTTTIPVTSGANFANGDYIQIDSEILLITAGGGTNSLTATRAQSGTTAATHANGATVTRVISLSPNILKITGQAAGVGAAASDVTAKLGTVMWFPAAS